MDRIVTKSDVMRELWRYVRERNAMRANCAAAALEDLHREATLYFDQQAAKAKRGRRM